LVAVTPGSGEIAIAPVSVCHHVSTMGTPTTDVLVVPHPCFGLIGSPTLPNKRRRPDRGAPDTGRPIS
jgi:hypothetical protein